MADSVKRSLARNLISEAGLLIAVIALANIIFLIYIDITSAENPYLGILTYVIVPAILVAGLLLFAFGLFWERRRPRRPRRELVRPLEALRRLPALCRADEQVPPPHRDTGEEPPPGPADLRAVPLAGEVLGRAAQGLQPLRLRRDKHAAAGPA